MPIGTISFFAFKEGSEIAERQTLTDLDRTSGLAEGYILTFFEKIESRAADWAGDGYIRSEAEAIFSEENDERSRSLANYLKVKRESEDSIISITDILDFSGRIVVSTDETRVNGSLFWQDTTTNTFKKAGKWQAMKIFLAANGAEANHAFVSELMLSPGMPSIPMLSIVAPLQSLQTGEIIGLLVNHISSEELNKILSGKRQSELGAKTTLLGEKQKLELYMVNRQGFMITPSRFTTGTVFSQRIITVPAQFCLGSKSGFTGKYTNYVGVPVFGVSVCPNDQWWFLVAEMSEDEALAGVKKIQQIIFTTVLPIGLVVVLIALVFGASMVRRITKNLRTLKELGNGNFDKRVNITGNDAIAQIGYGINQTAAEIQQFVLKIKNSEEKYKSLMENSADAILLVDVRGKIFDANKRAEILLEYPKSKLLIRSLWSLSNKSMEDKMRIGFNKMLEIGFNSFSVYLLKGSGKPIKAEANGVLIKSGAEKFVQLIFRE
ncbi:MAG: PAS domain S-box protein [Patescibacteria group bacterium]